MSANRNGALPARRRVHAALNAETRRLQQVLAIVIACRAAADQGAHFDVPDALAVVIGLLRESLRSLDRLQLAEVRHGRSR